MAVGALDLILAGSVLFVLLPEQVAFSLPHFLGIYLLAQVVALISNVPGGLGLFESMILLFAPQASSAALLDSLLLFRAVYYFSLGMAPLSGLENRLFTPLWNRIGAFIFCQSDHFYNFEGLRFCKEKFGPIWEPSYLACPGGFALPRILTNITTLISGDMKGVLGK